MQAHVTNKGFSYWKLTADQAVADITITNGVLTIDNFDGDLYPGKLRGKASFTLSNDAPYGSTWRLTASMSASCSTP